MVGPVLASERHARITEMLRDSGVVSTEQFALALDVSTETIRRDLVMLDRVGLLERVHGGATATLAQPVGDEAPFSKRSGQENEAKRRMGISAATLVRPGQTIAIDIGTSAVCVARALPRDFSGIVATNSLLVAAELADRPNLQLLVSGGKIRAGDLALSNATTNAFFADLYPDIAFLGSGGIDETVGLTDFHFDEVTTRKIIIANSTRSFVLADATKFGRIARHRVASFEQIAGLITDEAPPEPIAKAIASAGGTVLLAGPRFLRSADS